VVLKFLRKIDMIKFPRNGIKTGKDGLVDPGIEPGKDESLAEQIPLREQTRDLLGPHADPRGSGVRFLPVPRGRQGTATTDTAGTIVRTRGVTPSGPGS
jgi:hypothetical protein